MDTGMILGHHIADVDWLIVNDGVMGGVSRSQIRVTDDDTAVFEGELSLENNGGFASVRALLGPTDLSGYRGVALRVRGDGRTYQIRFRVDGGFDGVSYRAMFEAGPDWTTVVVPFDAFVPVFRGRVLRDRPPLDPSAIHQLGFMLADKRPGSFRLEVGEVRGAAPPGER